MGKPKDNGYHAVVHIMKAGVFAEAGMHNEAHDYARRARKFATAHVDSLASQEKHAEASHFNARISPMFTHLESVLSRMPKSMGEHIAGMADKVRSTVSKLKKAQDLGPAIPKRPNIFTSHEQDKTVVPTNRNPGRDARYVYKPFKQLSPENQQKARMAFRHSNDSMESYHYAHDPRTGSMVHGSRWLAPKEPPQASTSPVAQHGTPKEPPQATESVPRSGEILPQHMPGAAVHINSQGHDFHGSFGEVQAPNPQMPGQIRVKVKNRKSGLFEDTYVKPHEVKLKYQIAKSENETDTQDNVVLLTKSRKALKKIKSEGK